MGDGAGRRTWDAAATVAMFAVGGCVGAGLGCYESVRAGEADLAGDAATGAEHGDGDAAAGAEDGSRPDVAAEASPDVPDDADEEAVGDGGVPEPRECASDASCPRGWCRRVPDLPGGLWSCVYPPPEPATGTDDIWGWDRRVDSSWCEAGCGCYLLHGYYRGWYIEYTDCVCTECEVDADCPEPDREMCIAAGTWGAIRNRCQWTSCRTNFDCVSRPGGQCIAFCNRCSADDPPPVQGKYCRYPDDPCSTDADCGTGRCVAGPDGFECAEAGCPEWPFPPF